ncbi:MAG: hypothetical protein SGI72_13390 [Planctomycetota bacterium]|nr:hypothetical protein [Planctomycetota bacterium]
MQSLVLIAALASLQDSTAAPDLVALRGVWMGPSDDEFLARETDIAAACDFAWENGFNAVFPVVWRASGPMWPSLVTKTGGGIEMDPQWVDPKFVSRNVLTEIVIEGHRAGLEVVPVVDLIMVPKRDPKAALNALDPALQKFTSELVDELVGMHEVDAIAFDAHGLEGFSTLDDKGLVALGDFVANLRKTVDVRDKHVKFVLVDGGAAQAAWMERDLFDVAVARIGARDIASWKKRVEVVKSEPWCTRAPGKAALFVDLGNGAWKAPADFVLAAIAFDRESGISSEVVSSLGALHREDGALATALAQEPFYGLALLPWRDGIAWRSRSDLVLPKAGEGPWEWIEGEGGVRLLQIANSVIADASWTLKVIEKGKYDLFTWVPPVEDVSTKFVYSVAKTDGVSATTIDPTRPRYQGWVYLGTTSMNRRETREVAKLTTNASEPTKRTFAGPLVAIQSRRPR